MDPAPARLVTPSGELGAEATDGLRAAVQAALGDGKAPVVLDLSQVTFMDSTALSIVLGALREAWARGQALLVAGPLQPTVESLLAITGVERFLTVHDSRESAVEALTG